MKGSIYPDNMQRYGRVQDGRYPIFLGFHKRDGKQEKNVTQDDLEVRTKNFRAALIVNDDKSVPIESDGTAKTSGFIHIHNGFHNSRGSHGCLTIEPRYWSKFLTFFINAYPDVEHWVRVKKTGTFTGF